jgi:hypothetical protein
MYTVIHVVLFVLGAILLLVLFWHLDEVARNPPGKPPGPEEPKAQDTEERRPHVPVNRIKRYWKT